MQEAGYASVGEFHYLHHQPGGAPYDDLGELSGRIYDDLGELSGRIASAAATTGVGLTHLPVLYTYGGAGQVSLQDGQARFGNSVDRFNDLVARARDLVAGAPFTFIFPSSQKKLKISLRGLGHALLNGCWKMRR